MVSRWMTTAILLVGLSFSAEAAEFEFRHINDLFSASPIEDDLYTATLGLSGRVDGWTFKLDEFLFTDRGRGLRFDETYLTVSRELLPAESKWGVRAELGAARVGRGLYGERLQNFVHEVLQQEKLNLTYATEMQSHVFVHLDVKRTFEPVGVATIAPLVELESAGFKKHARLALGVTWELGQGFDLYTEGGVRFSETNYAPLEPWLRDQEPTLTVGAGYKRWFRLTWTSNYFGTSDNHWHVTARAQWGAQLRNRR
ncbi:MAG: hypothetical protein GTN89_13730 [Acidobacteria bacterium]|nr:hypothetical protein [Acidobacteriota bacterium]NIM60345.1 hypothetical protein [Acidobacteriota bacterium]NIO60346.1 hypothetical protein [Acidobacteriota bacterium]NIQ31401.1 hypothetical protein [Acidobacteriota bacterium]NIQ86627.1 hypothetical protein [Acidobacteriota bacterium]